MIHRHSKSTCFQWKTLRRVSGNFWHTLCNLSFCILFSVSEEQCHTEGVWLGVNRLNFLVPALPLMSCVTLGRSSTLSELSFVSCNRMINMFTTTCPVYFMDIFSPKNQRKSWRCKCSVNYSASQVYGDDISLVYSWIYQSGINKAWKLAIFFSVFKIL